MVKFSAHKAYFTFCVFFLGTGSYWVTWINWKLNHFCRGFLFYFLIEPFIRFSIPVPPVYEKFAVLVRHVWQIFKMSDEELLLNPVKCPVKKLRMSGDAETVFAYTVAKNIRDGNILSWYASSLVCCFICGLLTAGVFTPIYDPDE